MPTRFGAGFPKMPRLIGHPAVVECAKKCLADMEDLTWQEQLQIVETLGARLAWKLGRQYCNVMLDGIRKHAGQVLDGFLKDPAARA